jgi:hypothetical protein
VSIDFQVPLQWRGARDGRRGEWSARRQQAELLLQQERRLREMDVDKGLRERRLLASDMQAAQARLDAAREALRVASLRIPAQDADGIVTRYRARHAVYEAGLRRVDLAERQALAEVDLLALGPPCGTLAGAAPDDVPAQDVFRGDASMNDARPMVQVNAASPLPRAPAPAPADRRSGTAGIGWYVWNGEQLLQRPALVDELPAHTQRLLLSFTKAQLAGLDAAQWDGLRRHAHGKGIRLELLLGEPLWVRPGERQDLLNLLAGLRGLPLDGLNLDLERSQLPAGSMSASDWKQAVLDTLAAVRKAVPWSLALTTHHRDLDDPRFLQALRQAGVDEVVPMIYSQNAGRVRQVAQRLLAHSPGLRVGLAQSVEAGLSAQESSFHKGRRQSLAHWDALAGDLARDPRFSGVIVQSMDEYRKAKP